jgi:hypothetical protein
MPTSMYKNYTFEHPGVKAPGTAKMMTFLLAQRSEMLTLLAGEASKRSTLGTLSPTYFICTKYLTKHYIHNHLIT